MSDPVHFVVQLLRNGGSAKEITSGIEEAIRDGNLGDRERLPAIRKLAAELGVSPATVASAYSELGSRGLLVSGPRGTHVARRWESTESLFTPVANYVRNLADGNPDPDLLPRLGTWLKRLQADESVVLYGGVRNLPELVEVASHSFVADDIPSAPIALVSGALDGLERVFSVHLQPGDRVIVEDPGYPGIFDLITSLRLVPLAVGVDQFGAVPDGLTAVLDTDVKAFVVTPRAHNPTGAALNHDRAAELSQILRGYPELMVIEDDHGGPVAGVPAITLVNGDRKSWAVIRSMGKSLGPDLRIAIMTGDPVTVAHVEHRQRLGAGWVSQILQRLLFALLSDSLTVELLRHATQTYNARRTSLLDALESHGVEAYGRSGLNVWVPVPDEAEVSRFMLNAGWALSSGSRYRIKAPPGVRITISSLRVGEAERLATHLANSLDPGHRSRPA
jgi:DNA-binding transcriptional MocR family regulator